MWLATRLIIVFGLFASLLSNEIKAQQNSLSAFVYHRFGDDRYPSTNISLAQFEAHLKYLKDNDYQVLTLTEALNKLEKGKKLSKAAVLTVDDGYSTFYQNAIPLLKKYNFPATLFVNTETVGAKDFMTWEQISKVQQEGIEIGNHSHSHAYFLNQGLEAFKADLKQSEELFLENLGEVPKTFAYPYGEWSEPMAEHLKSKNYSAAVAQNSGIIYETAPRFHLPRFPMSEAYADMNGFTSKLNTLPLEITAFEVVDEGYLGSKKQPRLQIEFQEANLKLQSLQCFVQGANCKKSMQVVKNEVVKLTVKPDKNLNRRRTLFTITVPDRNGKWHWLSYSYVLPSIK